MASENISVSINFSTVCSGADKKNHQSSASLAFVRGIHRWLINSPHKGPVTWKMFSFDDVMCDGLCNSLQYWAPVWYSKDLQRLDNIGGFVQERRNFSALAMGLRLSCTNPSIWKRYQDSSPSNGQQGTCPIFVSYMLLEWQHILDVI